MTNKLNKDGLNPKQQAFCDEYINNGNNGSLAYKKAFKLEKEASCRAMSSLLLTNLNIVKYLKKKREEASQISQITRETLLEELKDIKDYAMSKDDTGRRELAVATKIVELKAKMFGLNEPDKLLLQGDPNNPLKAIVSKELQQIQNILLDSPEDD